MISVGFFVYKLCDNADKREHLKKYVELIKLIAGIPKREQNRPPGINRITRSIGSPDKPCGKENLSFMKFTDAANPVQKAF